MEAPRGVPETIFFCQEIGRIKDILLCVGGHTDLFFADRPELNSSSDKLV